MAELFTFIVLLACFGTVWFIFSVERKASKRISDFKKEIHKLDNKLLITAVETGLRIKQCKFCDNDPAHIIDITKEDGKLDFIPVCGYHYSISNKNHAKDIQK